MNFEGQRFARKALEVLKVGYSTEVIIWKQLVAARPLASRVSSAGQRQDIAHMNFQLWHPPQTHHQDFQRLCLFPWVGFGVYFWFVDFFFFFFPNIRAR